MTVNNGFNKAYGPLPERVAARDAAQVTTVSAAYTGAIADWDQLLAITFTSRGENVSVAAYLTAYVPTGTAFAFVALVLDGAQVVRVWHKMAQDVPTSIAIGDLLMSLAAGEHTVEVKGARHTAGGVDSNWRMEASGVLTAAGQ